MVNVFKKFRSLFKKTSKFEVIMDDFLVRQYFAVYCMFNVFYIFPKDDFKYLKNLKEIKVHCIRPYIYHGNHHKKENVTSINFKILRINEKDKYIGKIYNTEFFLPMKFVFEFENEEDAFYFKMKYC